MSPAPAVVEKANALFDVTRVDSQAVVLTSSVQYQACASEVR